MSSSAAKSEDTGQLRLSAVRKVFRLIGEIRTLGADPNAWRPHLVSRLRKMFGAQVVVSSEVHFRRTANPNVMKVVDVGWGTDEEGRTWQIQTEREDAKPEAYALAVGKEAAAGGKEKEAGASGPGSLVPVVPAQAFREGSTFIMSQFPLPHIGAVDQLGLHRAWGDAPFSRAQHKLVRLFHLELGRLWRKDVLNRAQDPTTDLPPRLTQTLNELLVGLSEKEIAVKLGLSRHTIHNYVKALHQRLGVSSRGELLAMAGKARTDFIPRFSVESPKKP
jgi:DNA-binding CsgD family transcriptional regulator